MKIVCLIRSLPPLIYFANRINERHPVSLVIVEHPSRNWLSKIRARGFFGTMATLRSRISDKLNEKKRLADYYKYFDDKWKSLTPDIPRLDVADINSSTVYDRLEAEQPALLLDHGTSLVEDHIIETAELALNLHWGLSPYYRGTHCTEWALINWDPYNIGVTIHKLAKQIDGGSILAQKRAVIQPEDTAHSINMQLTQLGTELVIKAIDKIESGEEPHFQDQDFSLGFLALNRQWSDYLIQQVAYIEERNLVEQMLKKPARKQALPIVELGNP